MATATDPTLALANINFDFSLLKLEPPAEFTAIGSALSTARRTAAEDGVMHSTFRKLAALFTSDLPKTPNLTKAYGERSSEIAASYQSSKETSKRKLGPFQEWSGLDATSVWAAATSGGVAIQIHLLACMLARLWTPLEATAIWVEFIEEKKHRLDTKLDDGVNLQQALASNVSLTRSNFADLDASTRAYLATADEVKSRQHTALNLAITNTTTPMSTAPSLFDNVFSTWTSAMIAMEQVLEGVPCAIRDGSVLLGFSAWHLYPDLYILSTTALLADFDDPVVKGGGLVTIGMSTKSSEQNLGIEWSLPLARMRSYGDPVVATHLLQDSSSKITMEEVMLVAFGSLMSLWKVKAGDFQKIAELMVLLYDAIDLSFQNTILNFEETKNMKQKFQYLSMLRKPAERIVEPSNSPESKNSRTLMNFGLRRSKVFLAEDQTQTSPVLFGLRNPHRLIRQLKTPQERLTLLRKVASEMNAEHGSLLIRYSINEIGKHGSCHVYSTATPCITSFGTAIGGQDDPELPSHASWAAQCVLDSLEEKIFSLDTNSIISNTVTGEIFWRDAPFPFRTQHDSDGKSDSSTRASPSVTAFEFVFGDPLRAAIFKKRGTKSNSPEEIGDHLLKDVLSKRSLDSVTFLRELGGPAPEKEAIMSLSALFVATRLYEKMPGTRINTKIFDRTLTKTHWARGRLFDARKSLMSGWNDFSLDLSESFSCVAWFETGEIDLVPSSLQNIMTIATGNSLYIPASLISDPSDNPPPWRLIRITGSLGRPGMILLTPVLNPMIRLPDSSNWNLINHAPWDGQVEDCFVSTSLHLKLTDWRIPLTLPDRAKQLKMEVFIQEAVVSVYDRGQWIGDLDVLPNLEKAKTRSGNFATCSHDQESQATVPERIVAIDSWEEFIDRPETTSIVRSYGNWMARLAATIMGTQLGHPTIILPKLACKTCVSEFVQALKDEMLPNEDEWDEALFVC